jgi:hypothetical protein
MEKVEVKVHMADSPVLSYQCPKCEYFEFEQESANRAINEIRQKEEPLAIKQKIIHLSQDRLGMYINRDVARSLNLKGGEDVFVSVPDRKHFVVRMGE